MFDAPHLAMLGGMVGLLLLACSRVAFELVKMMTQWSSTPGSKTQTGTLTWNANGTLQTLQITDNANSANAQTCSNLYDDLERMSSNSCAGRLGAEFYL
jgi:hypothetical protein